MADLNLERVPELETPHQRIFQGDLGHLCEIHKEDKPGHLTLTKKGVDRVRAFLIEQGLVDEDSIPFYASHKNGSRRHSVGMFALQPTPKQKRRLRTFKRKRVDLDHARETRGAPLQERGETELRVYATLMRGDEKKLNLGAGLSQHDLNQDKLPDNLLLGVMAVTQCGRPGLPYSLRPRLHSQNSSYEDATVLFSYILNEVTGNGFQKPVYRSGGNGQRYNLGSSGNNAFCIRMGDDIGVEDLVYAHDHVLPGLRKLLESTHFQHAVALTAYAEELADKIEKLGEPSTTKADEAYTSHLAQRVAALTNAAQRVHDINFGQDKVDQARAAALKYTQDTQEIVTALHLL